MSVTLIGRVGARLGVDSRVLENASWQIGDRVLRMLLGFVVSAWVVRYLGPESFGRLSYALAAASLFSPLANLGLDPIVVRELVNRPQARDVILGSTFGLRLIGGVLALAASVVVALAIGGDAQMKLLIMISGAALIPQAFDAVEFWFQARLRVGLAVIARNVALGLASALRIAAILATLSVVAFAWAGLIEAAVAALALVVAYQWSGESLPRWRFDRAQAVRLLADSWPLIFSNAMIMVYMRIDQLMLGRMSSITELGVYSVAVRLTEVWYVLPIAVVSSVFPGVIRARELGDAVFFAKLQRLYNVMALSAYAIALPTLLLAGPIVTLAFGKSFAGSVLPLQILIWTVMFTNLGVARSSFLTAMNWTRVHLFTVTIGAIVNVALNLVLIPRYGATGAAIATLVAQWLAAHGTCFLYPPMRRTGWMLTRAMVFPRAW